MTLTVEAVAARRHSEEPAQRVVFRVAALYGLAPNGITLPLNGSESIESGQVCMTLDPESDPTDSVGVIDYERGELTVRYAIHAVFPGLYELVTSGKHDPSLLNPVRAIATDKCTLTSDLSGWRALGCLEFLPGSYWAGAEGG